MITLQLGKSVKRTQNKSASGAKEGHKECNTQIGVLVGLEGDIYDTGLKSFRKDTRFISLLLEEPVYKDR